MDRFMLLIAKFGKRKHLHGIQTSLRVVQAVSNCLVAPFAVGLMFLSSSVFAAETQSSSAFLDNNDGTVSHRTTGLTWKRCAEGQSWTGSTCTGTAATYTWDDAKALNTSFAGLRDWRLPTIAELATLVDGERFNPAVNATMFPNAPTAGFWSASLVAEGQGYAWRINFYFGDSENDRSDSVHVRLVRGGQSVDATGLFTPTSDFIDKGDGTVLHKRTNLTWKRCAEGQSWMVSTCTGTARTYTWTDAKALSTGGWRLPTRNELQTIIEWARTAPAVNATIFPNIPTTAFWSSSAYLGNSNWAWYVNFGSGNDHAYYKTNLLNVRLVSGEQSAVSQTSTLPDCLFSWAEQQFPQFFPASGGGSRTLDVFTYRQYGSNTYLAVSALDSHLWTIFAGGAPIDLGAASTWYSTAGCR